MLTLEVLFLIIQNRDLEATLETLHSQPEQLKSGDTVEPIKALGADGSTFEITYNDPAQKCLLFVTAAYHRINASLA